MNNREKHKIFIVIIPETNNNSDIKRRKRSCREWYRESNSQSVKKGLDKILKLTASENLISDDGCSKYKYYKKIHQKLAEELIFVEGCKKYNLRTISLVAVREILSELIYEFNIRGYNVDELDIMTLAKRVFY